MCRPVLSIAVATTAYWQGRCLIPDDLRRDRDHSLGSPLCLLLLLLLLLVSSSLLLKCWSDLVHRSEAETGMSGSYFAWWVANLSHSSVRSSVGDTAHRGAPPCGPPRERRRR